MKKILLACTLSLLFGSYLYWYEAACRRTFHLPVMALAEYYKFKGDYSALNKIDKIYIISLDKTPERYERTKKIIEATNLPIEYLRLSAVDGKKSKLINSATGETILGSELATNQKLLNGEFEVICADDFTGDFKPLHLVNQTFSMPRKAGEIGCACSHRKVWMEIIKKGYKNVLVLEDDIDLIDHFKERLALAVEDLPHDYDLMFLGWFGSRKNCDANFKKLSLAKTLDLILSAEAYLITIDAAKKLLNDTHIKDVGTQIDREMGRLIETKQLNAYTVKVKLTHQSKAVKSVIDDG
jgi:glycosyl transferase family 25